MHGTSCQAWQLSLKWSKSNVLDHLQSRCIRQAVKKVSKLDTGMNFASSQRHQGWCECLALYVCGLSADTVVCATCTVQGKPQVLSSVLCHDKQP